MPGSLEPLLPHLPAFLMVFFRLGGIFFMAPLYASSVIPMKVRVLLALVLTFCVYPVIPAQTPLTLSMATLALAIGTELLIGLVIGFGASLPLIAMQVAGVLMGHQLGLGLARVMNPDFNEQTEVLSQLLYMVALVVFLLLDGHHALLATLVQSFDHIPLGGYLPDGGMLAMVVGLLTAMFELAIRVAAPLLCIIFLETVSLGFIARTVPQLNILSLGFPLRILMGFVVLIVGIVMQFDALSDEVSHALSDLMQYFG